MYILKYVGLVYDTISQHWLMKLTLDVNQYIFEQIR